MTAVFLVGRSFTTSLASYRGSSMGLTDLVPWCHGSTPDVLWKFLSDDFCDPLFVAHESTLNGSEKLRLFSIIPLRPFPLHSLRAQELQASQALLQ